MRLIKFLLIYLSFLPMGVLASSHTATSGGPTATSPPSCPPGEICNPVGYDTIQELILGILGSLYLISIPLVSIMVLYGGFLMVTSGGVEDRYKKGKEAIKYAIIGFVAVLLASGVSTIIKDLLS